MHTAGPSSSITKLPSSKKLHSLDSCVFMLRSTTAIVMPYFLQYVGHGYQQAKDIVGSQDRWQGRRKGHTQKGTCPGYHMCLQSFNYSYSRLRGCLLIFVLLPSQTGHHREGTLSLLRSHQDSLLDFIPEHPMVVRGSVFSMATVDVGGAVLNRQADAGGQQSKLSCMQQCQPLVCFLDPSGVVQSIFHKFI